MINYDGRRFRARGKGPDAAVTTYRQDGDLLWAELSGSGVRRGALTGRCADDGSLEFAYTMVLDDGRVVSGRCLSTPELLDDGRVVLHETWERFAPHGSAGVAELEEVP
jgi:hypothetical protein